MVWALLLQLVAQVGVSLCMVGVIATMPAFILMEMVMYRDVFGIAGALPPLRPQPVAPGAPPDTAPVAAEPPPTEEEAEDGPLSPTAD